MAQGQSHPWRGRNAVSARALSQETNGVSANRPKPTVDSQNESSQTHHFYPPPNVLASRPTRCFPQEESEE